MNVPRSIPEPKKRRRAGGILLLIFTALILGSAVVLRSGKQHLSAYRISEEDTDRLISSRAETDERLLRSLSFNGWRLFSDETDSTFYYSLTENDPDARDPLVRFEGDSERVRIALISGEITEETIEHNRSLHIIAYNDTSFREYRIRCTTLPLMNIESAIESIHGPQKDRDLSMTLFDNRAGISRRLIQRNGTIHVRGNVSTTVFPKLGYKMTLELTSPGRNIREADLSLLGMDRKDGEWLLYAGYNDQERIRNVFSSALWNRSCAGENAYDIQNGMEYRWLELFMNGRYWGLYALGYPLDYKQMTPARNTDTVENVYLYKKSFWTEGYSNLPKDLPMRDFDIRGKDALADPVRARELLAEYDRWLGDGAPGEASQPSHIRPDMGNAIDTWLFVDLIQGMDTVNAKGDYVNMFLTIVTGREDPLVIYTPWDLDLTWGNERDPKSLNTTVPYGITAEDDSYIMLRNPANFLLPENGRLIAERYGELRKRGWSDEAADSLLDEYEQQIFGSGAYRRDINRWPNSTQEDPELELSVFRNYVHERLNAMDTYVGSIGSAAAP